MKLHRICPFAGLLALTLASCSPAAGAGDGQDVALRDHADEWERLVEAEDARARSPEQLDVLLEGTRAAEPALRAVAVRALGRLERADPLPVLVSSLEDPDPAVRAAAARALALASRHDDPQAARSALHAALGAESGAEPLGAIAEALGRLRHDGEEEAARTLDVLLPHLDGADVVALPVLRGLYFLSRQSAARAAFGEPARAALRNRATTPPPMDGTPEAVRIRSLAVATLGEVGGADADFLGQVLSDPEAQVRRLAASGTSALRDTADIRLLAARALEDPSGVVRYEALRIYGARLARERGCDPVRRGVDDVDRHVSLLALDLLGTRCETVAEDITRLEALAAGLPAEMLDDTGAPAEWHGAARALLALAGVAPRSAAERIPDFAGHPDFYVRSYGARAAGMVGDVATLRAAASDAHPNVRTAAVRGLLNLPDNQALSPDEASVIYLAQLAHDDSQLLQASAAALEGSATEDAPEALLDALDRISLQRRETSRDARRAILARVGELVQQRLAGDQEPGADPIADRAVDRVLPYLLDFDPRIAALASDILHDWTGSRLESNPAPPPALRLPTFEEAARLGASRVIIEMADGGVVELRLLPFDAPTNAARFARLAGDGYFDGLTLHRIAPNFVVQGGSPNANEYTGHGPFTRDELGHPNWRGTVGLSTRGRDTGDAQLYINTVDNVRLDTDYTVFAVVERGMDVVDRMQEGALMRTVRVR